ncbi:MAG: type IV secretory system conjugative DNA transfer family protein, partial [Ruminococcus sp.]|nr:type IV secretory system conjugative DNA transfer family protein [Ruminococcus sp.]
MLLVMYFKKKNAKKYRHGEEYGSASWGTPEDIKPFIDFTDFDNNVILTQTERLTMGKPSAPKYARNKNILVIGGSGSGKTRFFVKVNIMQLHSSYVVTDPKGTVLVECGKLLNDNNYRIKVFNTVTFKKSMHYNPFAYIHSEVDILKFVEVLIKNTSGQGEKSTEDFWVKSERLLYTAYIALMQYYPEEERNFETLIGMLADSTTSENDENYKNGMDLMFEALEKEHPGCFACNQYRQYKLAAGKTAKSILISCGARLAPFAIREVLDITAYDEMQLDTIGDRKTALFIIISDTDATFNFLVAMMYSQMFNLLCTKADNNPDGSGKLKHHVRCILDEFANIGQIPDFEKLIATIRSREISASIILQSQSQLKAIYKDNADTIIGNCDSTLFLGGKE